MKKMTEKEAWTFLAEKMETTPNFICLTLKQLFQVGRIDIDQYEFMREDLLRFRPEELNTCSDAWWGVASSCNWACKNMKARVLACLFLAAMCE